jgi:hypothetical protein
MARIVEADQQGTIHLAGDWVGSKPHSRYALDVEGGRVVLRPVESQARPLWETLTPQQRIEDLRQWAQQPRPPARPLSNSDLSRENIYED